MSLEMNDLMALKSLENGMSPYEQVKIGYMQNKQRTSGVGIGGLCTGIAGVVVGIGAAIIGWNRGKSAQDVATAYITGTQRQLDQLTGLMAAERNERINGDQTITQTITDTVSGSQQGTLTAQQQAELSSVQSVMNNLFSQAVMGNLSENAQKVQIYSAPQPCGCPGCGCNG